MSGAGQPGEGSQPSGVVALDVGGTKIAAAVVVDGGELVLSVRREKARPERPDPGLQIVVEVATGLLERARNAGIAVRGIGAGFPEYVDATGRLTSREVLAWKAQPAELLAELGVPAVVDSDVRCAALAEACHGAGRGSHAFVYVSVGTGLSSTVVVDGRPLSGARGEAIALGELPVDGLLDPQGMTLERFASGEGIRRRYEEASGRVLDGANEVLAAGASGDVVAREVSESAARALGAGLAAVAALLDPDRLVVGGGMRDAPDGWWSLVREAYGRRTRVRAGAPPIVPSELGARAGILGAALAFEAAGIG